MENYKNNSATLLDGSINDSVTSLDVIDATELPDEEFRIRIDDEIMLVTGVTSNTLSVTRGVENTTPAAHTDGAAVQHILTAEALTNIQWDNVKLDLLTNRPGTPIRDSQLYIPTDSSLLYIGDGLWQSIGPLMGYKKPPTSGWSWVDQGSASVTSDDYGERITYTGASTNTRARVRALANTTAFTITCAFIFTHIPVAGSDSLRAGPMIQFNNDGGVMFCIESFVTSHPAMRAIRFTLTPPSTWGYPQVLGGNSTTFYNMFHQPFWMRMSLASGTLEWFYSNDRYHWMKCGAYSITTHDGSAVCANFGFGILMNTSITVPANIHLVSYEEN